MSALRQAFWFALLGAAVAPFIAVWLWNVGDGSPFWVGIYLTAMGALTLIALLIGWESLMRFYSPVAISFRQAISVAVIGLIVNLLCAWLLREDHAHHHHGHSHGHGHHHH